MQPNQNHAPKKAGEPVGSAADSSAFQPGESFNDAPAAPGEAGELPSWLQNFAGEASGSSSIDGAIGNNPQSGGEPESSAISPSADPHASPSASNSNVGFFSEDDLPEWLRALNADGPSSPGGEQVSSAPAASVSANGTVTIPPVTKAWVTTMDQPEVSTGANLLSSLVHVVDERPDAIDTPAGSPSQQSTRDSKPASKSRPAATVAPAPAAETTEAAATADAVRRNRIRMLAIAALIIVVLWLIVMLVGN